MFLSDNAFARWMNALTQNAWLEHLSISVWDQKMKYFEPFFQTLVQSIPTLKIKTFSIKIFAFGSGQREESAFLAAVKANYVVQSVQCVTTRAGVTDWLSRANQSRLNSYLLRNKKLAAWVENPLRLPSRLWPEAIALARDAGRDTLYCSWQALGVQGDGLKHKGRKRKLPQFYKPM